MEHKVFIVDDDPIMGNLLQSQLTESGFEAEYFSSGEDVLEKIFQAGPGTLHGMVIIADTIMPQTDGRELRRQLRQNPETAGIPFVFLSARDESSEQLEALQTDADDYVCKPFKMEELLDCLEKVAKHAAESRSPSLPEESPILPEESPNLSKESPILQEESLSLPEESLSLPEEFLSLPEESPSLSEGWDLAEMSLNDIMQFAESDCKSGELALKNSKGETLGKAFFSKGRLTDAQMGQLEGEEAFYALMEIKEGASEFHVREIDVPAQITESNSVLLSKAKNILDRSRQLFSRLPDQNILLNIRFRKIPSAIEEKAGGERLGRILSMIKAGQSVEKVINAEEMSRPGTASLLADLLDAGILEIPEYEIPEPNFIDEELVSFLKNTEKQGLTGILKIGKHQVKEAIYFQKGDIIHAYHGRSIGKKALYRILSGKGGQLSFQSQAIIIQDTIDTPLSLLIEEGDKEIETLQRLKRGSFECAVSINAHKPEKFFQISDHLGLVYILSLVQQYGRVKDIIDASQMTDLETYKYLLYMFQKDILFVGTEKKSKIRIITDSAADLPPEIIHNHNITLAPLSVSIGQQVYLDRIDLPAEDFYRAMKHSDRIPQISPPSEDDFHQLFRNIVPKEDVLAIFLSGKMSRTFHHASAAKKKNYGSYLRQRQKQQGADSRLGFEIVESGLVSLGMGLLVTEAADKIKKGGCLEEVRDYIRELIPAIQIFFVADTAAYLNKGGQIGKARTLLGNFFHTKPILVIQNGEMTLIDSVRGTKNAQELVLGLIQQTLASPETPIKVGVAHADAPELAGQMKDLLESRLNCRDIIMSLIGPVIGTRCGPGSVAVAFFPLSHNE
ncbi:MAG TPA: DegV family EDD domain-containing protein [Desulfobacterales bacterium]|nr:DegV family EDD domain-containing protein [Desulfobacterales bacterium]